MPFELPKTRVLEELAESVVSYFDKQFNGDGCSFFIREEGSLGRFRLVATTKLTRFIGTETIDAYDKEAVETIREHGGIQIEDREKLKGFGLTKYAIRLAVSCGEGLLSEEVEKDPLWSAQKYEFENRDRRCENMYCEVKASELLSYMAVPLLSKWQNSANYDPFGLIRIVRAKKTVEGQNKLAFSIDEFEEFKRVVREITPFFKTAVSISYLADLGNPTVQTEKFWDEVIDKLSSIVAGTGASVFEREEIDQDSIKYVCKASTGLYDMKGNKISVEAIARKEIYYQETLYEEPKSLTTWVARYKGNVIIKNTHKKEEFEEYYELKLNRERNPGKGRLNEHPDDISIIMVPVMSLDRSSVDAVIRIAKQRKAVGDYDSGFSNEQIKLFLSIIPAISRIFLTARRLELLESLGSRAIQNWEQSKNWEKLYKQLYKRVVDIVPRLLGAPGCTLLVARNEKLFGVASSAAHIQERIKENTFLPYAFGQGYTGSVAKNNKSTLFNDRKEAEDAGLRWSGRTGESEVGKGIDTCDRFLAVPVRSLCENEVIGVIRTAKKLYHDPFTEIDKRLLEVFADRLSRTIEEVEREQRWRSEQRERVEHTFSSFLVNECTHLNEVKCKDDVKHFFEDLESEKSDIRNATFDAIKLLWKKFLNMSFDVGKQLYEFENNILGEVSGYRDHFVHQFQIFLIGIYIIDRLLVIEKQTNFLLLKKITDEIETRWILTANFHDMASTVALIGEWLPKVVGVLLRKAGNIIVPSKFSNLLFNPDANYYLYLKQMEEILQREKMDEEAFMKQSLIRLEKGDHGVLTALSLLENLEGRMGDLGKEAALAIALHTMALNEKELKKIELGHISFDKLPVAFLLLYCDNLHEWGRGLSDSNSIKDITHNLNEFKIVVDNKMPDILRRNKRLLEKIGYRRNIIHVHAEIIVDGERRFSNKEERLVQLFNVLESDNPVFSTHLRGKTKSVLYDSSTHRPS